MNLKGSIRSIICLFVAFVLVFGLAACGNNEADKKAEETTAAGEQTAESTTSNEEPLLTYTYLNPYITINGSDTPVGKYIKDKFNIEFKFEKFTGSFDEKASLWLAARDYPEIVPFIGGNQDVVKKYIKAGALTALDPYLDQYGSNIKNLYKESMPIIRSFAEDKKMYFWDPAGPEKSEKTGIPFEMVIRSDALKAMGYPKVLTTSEWIAFLKSAIQKLPQTNGQNTIGFTMPLGEGFALPLPATLPRTGKYQYLGRNKMIMLDCENDSLHYFFELDYTKEAMKFFNTLYREGLFDKEAFTDKLQQTKDKLNLGIPLSMWYVNWTMAEANSKLAEKGQQDMQYSVLPIRLDSHEKNNDPRYYRYSAFRGFDMAALSEKCKDPERMVKLLDWAMSEEGQVMLGWGMEGQHYTVENGKRVPTKEVLDGYKTENQYLMKNGIELFMFLGLSSDIDKNGQNFRVIYDPSFIQDSFTETQKEVLKAYNWDNYLAPFGEFKPVDQTLYMTAFGKLDTTSDLAKMEQKIVLLTNQYIAKLIIAKDDAAFDALWTEVNEQIKKEGSDRVKAFYADEYQKAKQEFGK